MSRIERILKALINGTEYSEPRMSCVEEILYSFLIDAIYSKDSESRVEALLLALKESGLYSDAVLSRVEEILLCKLKDAVYSKKPESRIEELLLEWEPSDLIFIDYIEATGEQYIDTGVSINSGSMTVEMVFELTTIDDIQQDLFGYWATQGQQTGMIMFGVIDRQFCTLQYNWGFMWNWAMTPTINTRYTATVSVNSNTQSVTINGATYSAPGVPLFDSETVELFRNDRQWYAKTRLYSCKIWDGGTLTRDFVPALKDGEAGLYDKVSKEFFGNDGTGEFLYQERIPVYLTSDNKLYITPLNELYKIKRG